MLLWVPNFSEGRNFDKIQAIIDEIKKYPVYIADVYVGFETNRTVITVIGEGENLLRAAQNAVERALELIDMREHSGIHPRLGAVDVSPFVSPDESGLSEAISLARRLAQYVGEALGVPAYLYGDAAQTEERRSLANIRRGQYEALREKLLDERWKPDFGPAEFIPRSGAVQVGARLPLIALDIDLSTSDLKVARRISSYLRESGRKLSKSSQFKVPGFFPRVMATGWKLEERNLCQVTFNLLDYRVSPLHELFEFCELIARQFHVRLLASEIIGLVPDEAILQAGRYFAEKQGLSPLTDGEAVKLAMETMCLKNFDPDKKLLRRQLEVAARTIVNGKLM